MLCGDVAVALGGLATLGAGEAIRSLTDWALSPDHLAVRDAMGMSIAV